MTTFDKVFDIFFTLITDDMYLEISPEETQQDLQQILRAAIPTYEFPPFMLDYDVDGFAADLDLETCNILAQGMVIIWLLRQINSVEKLRQVTAETDFKISSQAAHLRQIQNEYNHASDRYRHLQLLQSRRRIERGKYVSTFDNFIKTEH